MSTVITNRDPGRLKFLADSAQTPELTDEELNAGQRAFDRARQRALRESASFGGPYSTPSGSLEP